MYPTIMPRSDRPLPQRQPKLCGWQAVTRCLKMADSLSKTIKALASKVGIQAGTQAANQGVKISLRRTLMQRARAPKEQPPIG